MKVAIKIIALLITLSSLTINSVQAQGRKGPEERMQVRKERMEKMRSMKWAYITTELGLTDAEMTRLKPIFMKHEQRRLEKMLAQKRPNERPDSDNISDEEAERILNERGAMQREQMQLREQYIAEIQTVLSAKQTLRLMELDREWSQRVVQKMKDRRKPPHRRR